MPIAYLLIGSNQGERFALLKECSKLLKAKAGKVIALSPIYETEAWGREDLPKHLNQAIALETSFEPLLLLKKLQEIETLLGRKRIEKWGLRTMDIDIIYYDNLVVKLPELTIPHPLLQERKFVLKPMCDIAAELVHPIFQKSNKTLLQDCRDLLKVKKWSD